MPTSAALPGPRRDAFDALKARLGPSRGASVVALDAYAPSGFGDLDRLLGGGFPVGCLVLLEGGRSSGRWSIVASVLAASTRRGLGAVIDDGEL